MWRVSNKIAGFIQDIFVFFAAATTAAIAMGQVIEMSISTTSRTTSGITEAMMNKNDDGTYMNERNRLVYFVENNYSEIAYEVATDCGEAVDSMRELYIDYADVTYLMNADYMHRQYLCNVMKDNYEELFGSDKDHYAYYVGFLTNLDSKVVPEYDKPEVRLSVRSMERLCEADMIIRGSVHSTGPRDENTSYVKFEIAKADSTVDGGNMLTLYGVGDTPFELGEEYIIFKMYDFDDYWAFKGSKVSYRLFKIIKIDDVIAVTNGYPIADLKIAIIDDQGVKTYDALPSLPFNPEYAKLSDFIEVVADYCKHVVE